MDENYLDDLLKGVSANNQKNNSFENNMEKDSGVDIDFSDLDDISLDELDGFDNLDFEDLDFDDIDFDDVDITNLDSGKVDTAGNTEFAPEKEEFDADVLLENVESSELEDMLSSAEDVSDESASMNEADLDSFFNDMMGDDSDSNPVAEEVSLGSDDVFAEAENQHIDDVGSMDLDDLFSALGIDETEESGNTYTSGEAGLDELFQATMSSSVQDEALSDIESISDIEKKSRKKKGSGEKKTISEILFGQADEDDAEEERLLEEKKALKQEKKAQLQEKKEAKKIEKKEKLTLKQSANQTKKQDKQAKKIAKEAELLAEYEAEKGQKQVPTLVVIIVFAAFAVLGVFVVFGSSGFDYTKGIKKATDYFERNRYRLAYDEVLGLDIKEEDEKLRDRIYTVMYVERLYESYENNMRLGRPDKALDSLIRGLENYDQHYDEALSLRIVEDVNGCKEKIVNALWNTYGLSEDAAYSLMLLEGQEYTDVLLEYCEGMMTGE